MLMPMPCWAYDAVACTFLEVNPAAERIYGYSRAEFLRLTLADIRRPAEGRRLQAFLDARARGEAVTSPRHWQHCTRSGEDIAVSVESVDFPCGELTARLVFVIDIAVQRASAVENKLLYECLETAGDMIVVTAADADAAGHRPILYVNRAFEQRTGYGRAEVLGRDPRLLQGPNTSRAELASISRALAAWQQVTVELLNYTRGGTPYWVEMTITPVADEAGWFHYWFSVERDVTARKTAEQALNSMNAELESRVVERTRELQHTVHELEAFSRTVSHDLQNPLNGVRGFAEMLQLRHGPALPADASRMLGLIVRSADQMHHIVEDMLVLVRISSMQARPVQVDLAALCVELVQQLPPRQLPDQPAQPVQLDTRACMPVRADLQLLRIVLHSLLSNACKFSGLVAPPVHIQVSVRSAAAGVVVTVADPGIGFDATEAQALFNPFQRLGGARAFEGRGTGLAKASRAAERMGGWVWADASPGRGARFHLFLPQQPAAVGRALSPPGALSHGA